MRNIVSKIVALALLMGVAQTLSACAIYAEPARPVYYHDHDHYWHRW